MAFATRTLTDMASGHAGGTVTVQFDHSGDSATTNPALDASALTGHANGAKLSITRAWWGLAGSVEIQFKSTGSDTHAIRLTGTGSYTGPAIKNNAVNTSATSGDLETIGASATGFIILELRKDTSWTVAAVDAGV